MKQISVIFSSIALIGVILLLVLRFAPDEAVVSEAETDAEKSEDDSLKDEKDKPVLDVLYVNTDTVMVYYDLAKKLEDQLQQQRYRYENRIKNKEKELMKKFEQFREKSGSMSRFEGQMKQQELQEDEQELYSLQEEFSESLNKAERDFTLEIKDSLEVFLSDYMKDKPHKIVLTETYGGAVLWGHEDANITRKVVDGLNERYSGDKNQEKKK